jgi:hypothetical protein
VPTLYGLGPPAANVDAADAADPSDAADAAQVPLYGLLLFGGPITVNHWAGGIMLGKDGWIKLRANTRIGVLCSQLRWVGSLQ